MNTKMIGAKIASGRKQMNLSQAQLAQQLFISPQAVGKWERGESMPDITIFNQLARIFGVDLNYFSENFQSEMSETTSSPSIPASQIENITEKKDSAPSWDMSKLNLIDTDFSGLKNLHEQFNSSNMQRCSFADSEMQGLQFGGNNIDACDFTQSNMSHCRIQSSIIGNSIFSKCNLGETEFNRCNIGKSNFTEADFTHARFKSSNFGENNIQNAIWQGTAFHDTNIQDVVFEGNIENCYFENCSFYGVKFQNANILNTFFKNNKKMKRVQFVDCKVDKITYAFLKSNLANLSGVSILAS